MKSVKLRTELQIKLLRVIQESEIMPVGFHQPKKVDVRIIASTNRDLKAEVAANRFRQDLFFRINVFSITIPPLRERKKDILPLAEFFLQQFSRKLNRKTGNFERGDPGSSPCLFLARKCAGTAK